MRSMVMGPVPAGGLGWLGQMLVSVRGAPRPYFGFVRVGVMHPAPKFHRMLVSFWGW